MMMMMMMIMMMMVDPRSGNDDDDGGGDAEQIAECRSLLTLANVSTKPGLALNCQKLKAFEINVRKLFQMSNIY